MNYSEFLSHKAQLGGNHGFDPKWMPDWLFDFQKHLVEWALQKGRAAIFADCGLGKTPMQLVWAENVVRKTGKPVLILTPLAVGQQTIREAEKFAINAIRSRDGAHSGRGILVTNYEQLHHFDAADFAGVVCDESSILKNFDGATRGAVTEFMRRIPYRLLCTATAAPNDFVELGTSSEALGELGYRDMVTAFFKQETSKDHLGWGRTKYRLKGHAELPFWRWVCSWARSCRSPADLGFPDDGFRLPPLEEKQAVIESNKTREGMLLALPAITLQEQREERRITMPERCEKVAVLVGDNGSPAVCWCHLNDEADMLERMIPDAQQVSGSMSDDEKESRLSDFSDGNLRVLVIKPKIGAFGLNWQHCHRIVTFPSHSYEQYYQSIRRCWRFGQRETVTVDIVTTEGERDVLNNLKRKSQQADAMFRNLVAEMNHAISIRTDERFNEPEKMPTFLHGGMSCQ